MKKQMILFLSILLAGVFYFILPRVYGSQKQLNAGQLHVAIFTPTTHPALQEIEQGFEETLQNISSKPYVFTTFNANGNRTLLRAQAEEIVNGNYDLTLTIGAVCSQTVAELIHKKGINISHVFTGVEGPEFAQSLASLNASSTGVYIKSDYKQEMEILHMLKPDTKNILLVYDPTHGTGLEKFKQEIEKYIKKFGTILHAVEVYQTNEIQQKVAASLPNMDVVLVLTDNTVVAGIDALVVLCNRYGVTLCASDLASGKKGAALAYGITEYDSGSGAAQKAYQLLIQGKKPYELPIRAITNFRVEVNYDTTNQQNLEVDNEILKRFPAKGKTNV